MVKPVAPTRTGKPRESAATCPRSPSEYSGGPGSQPRTPGPGPLGPRVMGRGSVSAVYALAVECQALPALSAAEQLLLGLFVNLPRY